MTTVTTNISLSDDLKAFVDGRIKARGYSSASEYMRDLVWCGATKNGPRKSASRHCFGKA